MRLCFMRERVCVWLVQRWCQKRFTLYLLSWIIDPLSVAIEREKEREKTKPRVRKKDAEKESVKDKIEREERSGWCVCARVCVCRRISSTKELTERNIQALCKILFPGKITSPFGHLNDSIGWKIFWGYSIQCQIKNDTILPVDVYTLKVEWNWNSSSIL